MNHYVYNIDFTNGMKYIGVRSCKCDSKEDTSYLGSSKIINSADYINCIKTILKTFDNRMQAVAYEAELHAKFDVKSSKQYYNQVNQTSTKFDQQGCTVNTHKHIKAMADKLRGRTKENYEYLKTKANKARVRGKSPKQIAEYQNRIGIKQGPNKAKALRGLDNPRTKPWYYVTDNFRYVEVHTSVTDYILNGTDVPDCLSERTIRYAMETKEHKPIVKGKLRGFTFGKLENKPDYINQINIDLMISLAGHLDLRFLTTIHKPSLMGTDKPRDNLGQFKRLKSNELK